MSFFTENTLNQCRLVLWFGNASQFVATLLPMKPTTLHIYGSTYIKSRYCENCQQSAFVLDNKMSCCGRSVPVPVADRYRVEVDTTNHKRQRVPKWLKDAILEEQGNKCFYCGDEFESWRKVDGQARCVKLQWDHLLPFSYNGNNANFVAACAECNQAKKARIFATVQEAKNFCRLKMHERKT